jgi:hypothetical protein
MDSLCFLSGRCRRQIRKRALAIVAGLWWRVT